MSKKILLLALAIFMVNLMNAQTTAENYKEIIAEKSAQIAEKQAAADALLGEIAGLKGEINALPGWEKGIAGTIGANLSSYNGWFTAANPNASNTSIGVGLNGYLNYDEPKYFWRNNASIVIGKSKVEQNASFSLSDLLTVADALNINSLGGYKLTEKIALSGMADYRTTVISQYDAAAAEADPGIKNGDSKFNNPGYLDIGVGATWLPIPKMVVVFHPLNYNIVFSNFENDIFESSAGCKIMADYNDTILGKFSWRSNASGFFSYKSSNLHNWTWVNSIGFNAFKGIGVGFEFGLRGSKQEDLANALATNELATFDNVDISSQSYWLLGLSFGF